MNIDYKIIGKRTLILSWSSEINTLINDQIIAVEHILRTNLNSLLEDTVITYHDLTIYFAEDVDFKEIIASIEERLARIKIQEHSNEKIWKIPVCYDLEFGWDLEALALQKKCAIEELITIHTSPLYRLYFMGFLPGFMYLGGLDSRLVTPRKTSPRIRVDKVSVAIGGNQTGIYPQNSPGGWQIIGKTPIELFNPDDNPPTPFQPGDALKFYAITREEYESIRLNKSCNLLLHA